MLQNIVVYIMIDAVTQLTSLNVAGWNLTKLYYIRQPAQSFIFILF